MDRGSGGFIAACILFFLFWIAVKLDEWEADHPEESQNIFGRDEYWRDK